MRLAVLLFVLAGTASPSELFETRVRPLLVKKCFACHAQSAMGGLQLTSRAGALKGGKRGPAISPGHAEQSLLVKAIHYSEIKMPPGGKLADSEIADIEKWIQDGAEWPQSSSKAGKDLWSLQPLKKSAPGTTIDGLIDAALKAKSLTAAGPADPRTWLRRVTFDLTGLPPTPEQMAAFLADKSPGARREVVDRLLASPRYGERWARFWLDIARYSDDNLLGSTPYAWHYRDWVIRSFNEDLPYNTFVKAHFAADQMGDPKLLPALTMFLDPSSEFSDDDRVDVLGRGFLGLTIGCAQCHDHKYDPIPTKDYYSLLGVFKSTRNREVPLAPADVVANFTAKKKHLTDLENSLKEFQKTASQQVGEMLASRTADYRRGEMKPGLDPETLERWKQYLARPAKQHRYLEEIQDPAKLQELVINLLRRKKEADEYNRAIAIGANNSRELGERTGKTLTRAEFMLWQDMMAEGNSRAVLIQPDAELDGVFYYKGEKVERFLTPAMRDYLAFLREEIKKAKANLPPQYPYLTVIEDAPHPANLRIHIRGNAQNLGDEAPRRFLSALCDGEPKPFHQGSGRLELAGAIADPANPLTARVIVNRVWAYHFGKGIVLTPSNFGQTGGRPSHPELLDHLTSRFIENGWSLKKLHREIVLSEAYGRAADYSLAAQAVDPDNRYLWRQNRRRLDAEALRDAVLAVSGTLQERDGGAPLALDAKQNVFRSIYGTISRQKTDSMLLMFDFPNPNVTSESRTPTTVPLQRLLLLNSDFWMDNGAKLAARSGRDLGRVYQLLFQRQPAEAERAAALQYLQKPDRWPLFAQALLASDEFLYVD